MARVYCHSTLFTSDLQLLPVMRSCDGLLRLSDFLERILYKHKWIQVNSFSVESCGYATQHPAGTQLPRHLLSLLIVIEAAITQSVQSIYNAVIAGIGYRSARAFVCNQSKQRTYHESWSRVREANGGASQLSLLPACAVGTISACAKSAGWRCDESIVCPPYVLDGVQQRRWVFPIDYWFVIRICFGVDTDTLHACLRADYRKGWRQVLSRAQELRS